jgi:hypothetical protein
MPVLSVEKYKELKYFVSCFFNFPELDNNRPVAHETAVCPNPSIHSFREDRKRKLDGFSADRQLSVLCV